MTPFQKNLVTIGGVALFLLLLPEFAPGLISSILSSFLNEVSPFVQPFLTLAIFLLVFAFLCRAAWHKMFGKKPNSGGK